MFTRSCSVGFGLILIIALLFFGCNKEGSPSGTESTDASGCISNPPEEVNTPGVDKHNGKKFKHCKHRHHKNKKHPHDTLPGETPGDTTSDSDTTSGTNDDANCNAFSLDNGTVFLADFNNNLNDTVTGNAGTLTAGSFANSLYCNGIKLNYIGTEKGIYRFPENQQLILSRGTMEALVYAENVTSDFTHIIDKSWQYGLTAYNGMLAVHFGHWWYSSVPMPIQKWSYIAGSYDGTTIRLYLNGVCVASSAYTGNGSSSYELGIGNASAGSHNVPFIGTIDEVRISATVRTPAEIANTWTGIAKKIQ
jgi:hypothetical protein